MSYGYKKLDVWNKSYQFSLKIYNSTKMLPKEERYGLISQMRRASVSIIANLAEGYNKKTTKDFIKYVNIAIGSCNEMEVFLMLSKDLQYFPLEVHSELENRNKEIGRMLFGLDAGLRKKLKDNTAFKM